MREIRAFRPITIIQVIEDMGIAPIKELTLRVGQKMQRYFTGQYHTQPTTGSRGSRREFGANFWRQLPFEFIVEEGNERTQVTSFGPDPDAGLGD
jgi:hypothetical protein